MLYIKRQRGSSRQEGKIKSKEKPKLIKRATKGICCGVKKFLWGKV